MLDPKTPIERVVLHGRRVTLEPISVEHLSGLASAIMDGNLWEIPTTVVPEPSDLTQFLHRAEAIARFGGYAPQRRAERLTPDPAAAADLRASTGTRNHSGIPAPEHYDPGAGQRGSGSPESTLTCLGCYLLRSPRMKVGTPTAMPAFRAGPKTILRSRNA